MSKQLCAVKKRLQSTYAGTSWWWYYCGSSSVKALILTWILLCSEFRIVLQKQKKLFWSTLVSIDHPSKYTDCVLPIIDQSVSIESIISTILSRLSSPASAPYLSSTPDCLHQHHTLIQQVGLVHCWVGIFLCLQLYPIIVPLWLGVKTRRLLPVRDLLSNFTSKWAHSKHSLQI